MPKQGLTFYVLNEEVIRKRIARHNIELKCCLCGGTLRVGDNVVRKRRKMYHRICWENTYTDIPDNILNEEDLCLIESGSIGVSSTFPITTSTISTNIASAVADTRHVHGDPFNTIPATITFGVVSIGHGDLNQKH